MANSSEFVVISKDLLAGGLSGSLGIVVGLPWDIVKVRMQTHASHYKNAFNCFTRTIKDEGILALFKGGLAPITSQFFVNAILFATQSAVVRILEPGVPVAQQSTFSNYTAGLVGGLTQCVVLVPAETLKCKMQVDGAEGSAKRKKYKNTLDCMRQILRAEGVAGLYRGGAATAVREVPSIGIYFASYKYVRNALLAMNYDETLSTIIGGAVAGASSWTLIYPADVIKTVIQTASTPEARARSYMQTARYLYQTYGMGVFFRGLSPTIFRAFPVNAVTFVCYEESRKALGIGSAGE
jgi:solute carrier family 25 (mitochondrial carnitine/acylcarnitine transporter), member 20/29